MAEPFCLVRPRSVIVARNRSCIRHLALPFLGARVAVFTVTRSVSEAEEPSRRDFLAHASGYCAPRNGRARHFRVAPPYRSLASTYPGYLKANGRTEVQCQFGSSRRQPVARTFAKCSNNRSWRRTGKAVVGGLPQTPLTLRVRDCLCSHRNRLADP